MSIAGPALIEAYAVLTRLPLPHRLNAQDAVTLLEENFIKRARTVVLNAHAYHMLVRQAPEKGIAGGQTYDAVVSACAAKAQVDTVLTFDHRHFESLVDPSIELIIPGWKNA
jgi:predicted nucleic acid-binding protein